MSYQAVVVTGCVVLTACGSDGSRHIEDAPLAQIGARYGRALWPSLAPDALELDVGIERVSKEEVVHSRARAAQDLVVETELYERWLALIRPGCDDTGGRALKDSGEYLSDFAHLVASHAERRDRGSAEPQSARVPRTVGVVGDDVAVQRDPGRAARGLGLSSVEIEVTDIDEHEMVVRFAGHDRNIRGH